MCGVVGAIGRIDEVISEAVNKISNAMSHRGPDGQGLWKSNGSELGVVLAHRRLAILDLSEQSAQPMIEPETGCVISYNGELYNFQALRETLINKGHTFDSSGDTEVILKAYVEWGEDCVNEFEGMFAFAIFDPRKNEVFIARDPVGIKPLYYSTIVDDNGRETVLFASELKALLASDLIDRILDPQALSTYLWNGFVIEPLTMVKGIHLLEAGHALSIGCSGDFRNSCYWENTISATTGSFERAEFEQKIEKIVQQHMISDVPVGVFLSGGIDSSFIAALAARNSKQAINTFCITFSESEYSESKYAKQVSQAIGSNHHEFLLTDEYFAEHLEDALESLDQPSFDGINTYFVSRAVSEQNLKVALAGTGGDELFGGYTSFAEIPLVTRWAKWIRLIPVSARKLIANSIVRFLQGRQSIPLQTRWGKLADILAGDLKTISAYQTSYGLFTKKFLAQLSPKYHNASNMGLSSDMQNRLERVTENGTDLQAVSAIEENIFLGQRLLRDSDACSMSVSLEVRVPLVGKDIYELLDNTPEKNRFFPIGKKQLLRDTISSDLPSEIFDRPKRGFELPMDTWLRTSLSERGKSLFFDEKLVTEIGLNAQTIKELWNAHQAGEKGLYWSRVWSLYVLLWWCKKNSITLEP